MTDIRELMAIMARHVTDAQAVVVPLLHNAIVATCM